MNNIIFDKESRILLYANGAWAIVSYYHPQYRCDGQDMIVSDNYRRKEKIIRNRPLPKWIQEELNHGNAVIVDSAEIVDGNYLKIVGHRIKAVTTIVEKTESYQQYGKPQKEFAPYGKWTSPVNADDVHSFYGTIVWHEEETRFGDLLISIRDLKDHILKDMTYISRKRLEEFRTLHGLDEHLYKTLSKTELPLPNDIQVIWNIQLDNLCKGGIATKTSFITKRFSDDRVILEGSYRPTAYGGEFTLREPRSVSYSETKIGPTVVKTTHMVVAVERIRSYKVTASTQRGVESEDGYRLEDTGGGSYYLTDYKVTVDNGESFITSK